MQEKTFRVINFGCRATQADGAAIEQAFLNHQLGKAEHWENSDLVVINTCTVTQSADAQARQMIRRVHRVNPSARIVVTGCYAQRASDEIAGMEGVSCVVGNSHKDQLVPLVLKHHVEGREVPAGGAPAARLTQSTYSPPAAVYCSSIFEAKQLRSIADMGGGDRTRPMLKVQDGCSYRCTYCVIPSVRGDSRSLPEEEVLRQVDLLLKQGFKEIVLTGIHLGAYGRDLGGPASLATLLRSLLERERLERLRLSSVEPLEMTEEIIELVAQSPRMAQHFHIPLQCGSDQILRRMRRPYSAEKYARLLERIRRTAPEAAIGADVMVGFPTETDADHEMTRQFLEDLPLTYLHVFPYSERPGTDSASLMPKVPAWVAQQRGLDLRLLSVQKNLQFRSLFLGKKLSVITLDKEEDEGIEAISSNYLKVEIPHEKLRSNQLLDVRVTQVTEAGLIGER